MTNGIGRLTGTALFGVIAAVVGSIAVFRFQMTGALAFDAELAGKDLTALLMNLAIIALLVERTIEIAWTAQRGQQKSKILRELEVAKSVIPVDDDRVTKWTNELIDYSAATQKFALRFGFVIGLAMALGGVRVLEVLFNTSGLSSNQFNLVVIIDVILTACLIAGGSKGINTLTSRIQKMVSGQERAEQDRTVIGGSL